MRTAPQVRALRPAAAPPLGAAALAVVAVAFLLLPSAGERTATAPDTVAAAHPAAFFDERTFALAIARVNATEPERMPGARAIIVPHHLLAADLILGGLRDLAASGDYDRVILIGPNHVSAGGAAVITSDLSWRTPFGAVQPDAAVLDRLTGAGIARSEPDVLTYEHSIGGIVPGLARYLPGATVVPLVLRHDLPAAEVQRLAAALAPLLDGRTAIVAAVDFSHYLPAGEARQRDGETLAALQSLDSARILSFGDEHLDSPAAIATVMEALRLLGSGEFELRGRSDSSELGGPASGVTSYIAGYYR